MCELGIALGLGVVSCHTCDVIIYCLRFELLLPTHSHSHPLCLILCYS